MGIYIFPSSFSRYSFFQIFYDFFGLLGLFWSLLACEIVLQASGKMNNVFCVAHYVLYQ